MTGGVKQLRLRWRGGKIAEEEATTERTNSSFEEFRVRRRKIGKQNVLETMFARLFGDIEDPPAGAARPPSPAVPSFCLLIALRWRRR